MNQYAKRLAHLAVSCCLLTLSACAQGPSASKDSVGWSHLAAIYDYPANTRVDVKEVPLENADCRAEAVSFQGPEGDGAKGFFFRPKAEGVYPVVLVLHGLGDSAKGGMVTGLAKAFTDKGLAVFALDAPHHGDRSTQQDKQLMFKALVAVAGSKVKGDLAAQLQDVDKDKSIQKMLTETVRQGVKDYRSAIDWLSSRKDVRRDKIGAFGYSLGSIMSSILAGVDSRVKSTTLCVGGDPSLPLLDGLPADEKEGGLAAACSLYIGHAAGRPILMLNGKTDQVIPKTATDRLYAAAKDPKEIRWYDSGHALPMEAIQDAVKWTTDELKGK